MDRRNKVILDKILDEIKVIALLIDGYDYPHFESDEKTKRAVCMTLINIGELVKNLSDDFKSSITEIPWRKISGLRDVTAHGYQALRMDYIWETIITDVPALEKQIQGILEG